LFLCIVIYTGTDTYTDIRQEGGESVSKHHTIKGREKQIMFVKDEIIRLGGYQKIDTELGIRHFTYYVADSIGCTFNKAREYIELVINSSIARARIEKWKDVKNADLKE